MITLVNYCAQYVLDRLKQVDPKIAKQLKVALKDFDGARMVWGVVRKQRKPKEETSDAKEND